MPITILDLAIHRGAKADAEGAYSAEELARVGFAILGGCASCGATLGAYNACPSRGGVWLCRSGCIDDYGYDTVEEASREIFALPGESESEQFDAELREKGEISPGPTPIDPATDPIEACVERYLVASTGNLPHAEFLALSDRLARDGVIVREHQYGAYVHVATEPDRIASVVRELPALAGVMEVARARGCTWINLDQDAEPVPGLPFWEW